MSFAKFLIAVAFCLVGCSASDDQFSYEVCMEDVEGTMNNFTDQYMWFEGAAHTWVTQTNHLCINKLAQIKQATPCKSLDFVRQIFNVCGGAYINAADFIPASDDIDTAEKACTWLSQNAPVFVEKLEQNKEMAKNCDIAKTFDQIVEEGFCFIQKK